MGNDLPFVAILLFSKEDADIRDVIDHSLIIQDGSLVTLAGAIVEGELDMTEFEGLSAQGLGLVS